MLGEAHHVRNDETMASRLLALAHKLNNEYAGSVGNIVEVSTGRREFEKPLLHSKGCPQDRRNPALLWLIQACAEVAAADISVNNIFQAAFGINLNPESISMR